MKDDKKIEGLGDVVAVIAEKTGLKHLAPKGCNCKRRQAFLNKKFPIK